MRRLLVVLAVFALALPAQADECLTLEFGGTYHNITSETGLTDGTIKAVVVGPYLQIQYGGDHDSLREDTVSVNILEASGATICVDGSVSLTYPAVVEPPAGSPATETVDLVEEYADHQPFVDWWAEFQERLKAAGLSII